MIPPSPNQKGFQQGGCFVFDGDQEVFAHRDPSTGAHADLNLVVAAAQEAADRKVQMLTK